METVFALRDSLETPGKRTNSLGRAQVDCAQCASLNTFCDRQRPKCGACECKRSVRRPQSDLYSHKSKFADKRNTNRIRQRQRDQPAASGQGRECTASEEPECTGTTVIPSSPPSQEQEQHSTAVVHYDWPSNVLSGHCPSRFTDTFVWSPTRDNGLSEIMNINIDGFSDIESGAAKHDLTPLLTTVTTPPCFSLIMDWLQSGRDASVSSSSSENSDPESSTVSSTELYLSGYRFELTDHRLLAYYENNVALVPWTNPSTELNSLRLILPLVHSFEPLMKAVMALSAAHYPLELSTCLTYKSQALTTFSDAMRGASDETLLDQLLATVLILLNLQSVESGYGQWAVHLRGARHLLIARFRRRDITSVFRENPMLHSVVLQISWYDTICALMSLQPCEIPDTFVRPAVLLSMEKMTSLSLGGMTDTVGCQEMLYLTMRGMISGKIRDIHQILKVSELDFPNLVERAASPSEAAEIYYAQQAWKYACVVYLLTKKREHMENASMMGLCTNLVTTYAQNLTSSPYQKQILVPLVITGAQVDDAASRNFFRAYCLRHRSEVKYAVYESGLHILERTWALRDRQMADGSVASACWTNITGTNGKYQYMLG